MNTRNLLHTKPQHPQPNQRGVTLIIVLVGMVALMLAALALLRSVDASTLISGNAAFRGAAAQVADLGVEAAAANLPGILTAGPDTPIAGQYYPTTTAANGGLTWDTNGLPPSSVWASAPQAAGTPTGYKVQYIIERLCTGPLPVSNIRGSCSIPTPTTTTQPQGNSNNIGATPSVPPTPINYRVTVQVNGPHNTTDYVQTVISD